MIYYAGTVIPSLNEWALKVDREDFELDASTVRGILRGLYIYPKTRKDLWYHVFKRLVDIEPDDTPDEIIAKLERDIIPHYKKIGVIPEKDFFVQSHV